MTEDVKFNLRLPSDLYADLAEEADYKRTSRNAVVVAALRNYLPFVKKQRPRVQAYDVGRPKVPAALPGRPADVPRVGANQPCPCGSGEKYKRCHGAPGRA